MLSQHRIKSDCLCLVRSIQIQVGKGQRHESQKRVGVENTKKEIGVAFHEVIWGFLLYIVSDSFCIQTQHGQAFDIIYSYIVTNSGSENFVVWEYSRGIFQAPRFEFYSKTHKNAQIRTKLLMEAGSKKK